MSQIKLLVASVTFFFIPVLLVGCANSKSSLVESHLNEGEYQKALKEANKAIKNNPDNKILLYRRGQAKKRLQRYDEAIEDFQKALKLNEGKKWAKWPVYRIGEINMERKRYQEAVENFSSALSFDPNWVTAIEARAEAKSKMGDEVGAEEDRHRVRQIKKEREKRRKMEAWNEATGGAPGHQYANDFGPWIVGDIPWNGDYESFAPYRGYLRTSGVFCEGTTLKHAKENLGGVIVKENKKSDGTLEVKWRFTWGFESHPEIQYDHYYTGKFKKCEEDIAGHKGQWVAWRDSWSGRIPYESHVDEWGFIYHPRELPFD